MPKIGQRTYSAPTAQIVIVLLQILKGLFIQYLVVHNLSYTSFRPGKRTLPPRDAYVEDMFEAEEAGPSKKTRRGPAVGADPQNDFTCYVLHCSGQKNNYKNASSFKRHLL